MCNRTNNLDAFYLALTPALYGRQVICWLATIPMPKSFKAFEFDRSRNPNSADKVFRSQALTSTLPSARLRHSPPDDAPLDDKASHGVQQGMLHYERLQDPSGFWPADYGGPMFLLPGLVITTHITSTDLGRGRRAAMLRYLWNHQQDDGA